LGALMTQPARLSPSERDARIVDVLRDAGFARTDEIAERFGISRMTAMRDFVRLQRQGLARRTFGGIVTPPSALHQPEPARADAALAELGRAAAALVQPGELVLLDASPAAVHVAEALVERELDVTVLTNGLAVMGVLATEAAAAIKLRAASGRLRGSAFAGEQAVQAFRRCVADRAFLGGCATVAGTVTAPDPEAAAVARAMVAAGALTFLLDDGTQPSRPGHEVAPLARLAGTVFAR
jgi:DeoR/GlpR family transcriptional regulator of sugar metabolism